MNVIRACPLLLQVKHDNGMRFNIPLYIISVYYLYVVSYALLYRYYLFTYF